MGLQDAVDRGWLLSEASHFRGVVGLKRLLLTALELATALAYLHSVDIMHGDLTGGNVLLHSAPVTPTDPRGFVVKARYSAMPTVYGSWLCQLNSTKWNATWLDINHYSALIIATWV